jgi:hypothetical protein
LAGAVAGKVSELCVRKGLYIPLICECVDHDLDFAGIDIAGAARRPGWAGWGRIQRDGWLTSGWASGLLAQQLMSTARSQQGGAKQRTDDSQCVDADAATVPAEMSTKRSSLPVLSIMVSIRLIHV